MDQNGAKQLLELVNEMDAYKDIGKGSVSDFSGKGIIGVLAGPAETTDPNNKRVMDTILHKNGFLKWFEEKGYGDDPCSSFQASGASCDAPAPSEPPSNGPTAPAAVPCRVGRLLAPMRGSAMLVRPRLANRVTGCRPSF
ncbi:hypothetical protein NADE_007857 [Nannochloris sp. 'desiccata']|nr:hypothetical protein NADE_007857 [Chlorella desiccata (nom. nud.)]